MCTGVWNVAFLKEKRQMQFSSCLIVLSFCFQHFVSSYYLGEHVDVTLVSINGGNEVLDKQKPLFGIDSTATFPRSRSNDRFSLSFAGGYHQLSWFDTSSLGKIRVTFVYSRSGDGTINSVSSEPVMRVMHDEYSTHNFEIEYAWIEEQPVDFDGGLFVMFLAIFLFLFGLAVQDCYLTDEMMTKETVADGMSPNLIIHDE